MNCSDSKDASIVPSRAGLGGEDQANLSRGRPATGWLGWIASVVAVSALLTFLPGVVSPLFSGAVFSPSPEPSSKASPELAQPRIRRRDASDACASGGVNSAEYNVPLHVGALFTILGVSSVACGFPLLAARFAVLRVPQRFLFAIRHFGTGVLLATAFVHLLPTAFISLGNPCLSEFWTSDYPAMPGAIALVGIFFVAVMEMVFSPARQFTPGRGVEDSSRLEVGAESKDRVAAATPRLTGGLCAGSHAEITRTLTRASAPVMSRESIELQRSAPARERDAQAMSNEEARPTAHVLTPEQQHKKDILQCMMLEVGILFHSVFIGMALSVAVGGNFVVLLIAIAFHQTFEGLALGARIASISWPETTWQPWLMVLAYGCT